VHTAYLGLGSNVDANSNIRSGIDELRGAFETVEFSPVYRSAAVGFNGDDFINLVARIETTMSPLALKLWLNELEERHGRRRDVPKVSDRTLDIDILLFDELCLQEPGLEIPRAEILTSAHVLKPLADLAPKLLHPARRRSMEQLWQEFSGKEEAGLRLLEL
jgi:2-amino-4-hydroxy-6-hydroxymethyldihydropteridine diphosphokinase